MQLPPAEIMKIELDEAHEDRRRMAVVPIALAAVAMFGAVLWWVF